MQDIRALEGSGEKIIIRLEVYQLVMDKIVIQENILPLEPSGLGNDFIYFPQIIIWFI